VVLEAGSMGLHGIVKDFNGSNEIIINEHNGIIISVKDTWTIFGAMIKIMTYRNSYLYLKQNTRKKISDNYQRVVV